MNLSVQQITCPHCQKPIKLEDVVRHQIEESVQIQLQQKEAKLSHDYQTKIQDLNQREKLFEEKKKNENQLFQERLAKEKTILQEQTKQIIEQEFTTKLELLNKELERSSTELNNLKVKEIELEQLKRKMVLQHKEMELSFEKKLSAQQKDLEDQVRKRIHQEMELKLKEKDKQLDDQKKLLSEMQRKVDQGSMQLSGEVQELAIEEWLRQQFPLDDIIEIKKGIRGADCQQIVHNANRKNCGIIYYESKRTKEFQSQWLEKFKQDMISCGADMGVLVTQTLPKDMERMGERLGIWICKFEEFKSLAFILRQMLIKISEVSDQQRNRGDKMELLYKYLTSNEFKLKIESIVDGFTQMQDDLQKEKNAMYRIWSQREKQIQKVLVNTTEMYGDFRGIAGPAIPSVKQLELPKLEHDIFDFNEDGTEGSY